MPPAHSLLRASTSNALSTRFTRGSPISTAFARLCFLLAPFACSPSLRMTASTRFSLTTMPSWIGYTMLDSFMRDAGSPEGKESAWRTRTTRGASPTTSSAR